MVAEVASKASYRDLVAWQEAMDLVVAVYRLSQDWPKAETYGLL